jgi:hypothetical protein
MLLQTLSVIKNVLHSRFGWFKSCSIQFLFNSRHFLVLALKLAIAKQSLVNLLRLLGRCLEV